MVFLLGSFLSTSIAVTVYVKVFSKFRVITANFLLERILSTLFLFNAIEECKSFLNKRHFSSHFNEINLSEQATWHETAVEDSRSYALRAVHRDSIKSDIIHPLK
jgi:hypothetical protein